MGCLRKRWRRLLVFAAVPALLGLSVFELQTCIIGGYLTGEAFYHGRPTRYWSRELQGWNGDFCVSLGQVTVTVWTRRDSAWEEWLGRFFPARSVEYELSPLVGGDPDALPMLMILLDDPHSVVRRLSAYGLGNLEGKARPAVPALLKVAQEPDEQVRLDAINALRRIDYAAAAKVDRR